MLIMEIEKKTCFMKSVEWSEQNQIWNESTCIGKICSRYSCIILIEYCWLII